MSKLAPLAAALVVGSRNLRAQVWRLWPFAAAGAVCLLILLTSSQVAVHASGMKGEQTTGTGYSVFVPSHGLPPDVLVAHNLQDRKSTRLNSSHRT